MVLAPKGGRTEFQREIYSILDLIGDCGGLFDGLSYCSQAIVSFVMFFGSRDLSVFLLGRIFFVRKEQILREENHQDNPND